MVKLTYCIRRRADMTWDEFSAYWRDVHAPLIAKHAEALGIRRYVQVRTAPAPGLHAALQGRNGGSPEPFDGVAELWFDSLDAFTGPASPEAKLASKEVFEDQRMFIDLAASPQWLGEEAVIIDGPS